MQFRTGDNVRSNHKTSDTIKNGNVYAVLEFVVKHEDSIIYIIDDNGDRLAYYAKHFDLVSKRTMQDWIDIGKTLVNKEVRGGVRKTRIYTPDQLLVIVDPTVANKSSMEVQDDFRENGFSVALFSTSDNCVFPVKSVELNIPKSIKMFLTEDYDAEIFRDRVVVGCQNIPRNIIEEMYVHMKSLD